MGGSIESLPADAKLVVADEFGEHRPLWEKSSRGEGITLSLDPLPVVTLGSTRGLRVMFSPGFLVSLTIFWIGGAALWTAMADTEGTEVGSLIGLSSMPTDIFSADPVIFGLVFALAMQVSAFLYALGHGVGYTLTGRYLAALELGIGGRAYPSEDPKNSYQQLGSAFVGGLLQPLVGIAGLLILGGPGWSALQISFLAILTIGLLNFLVPAGRNSSATKLWLSLGRVIAGKGGRDLSSQPHRLAERSLMDNCG